MTRISGKPRMDSPEAVASYLSAAMEDGDNDQAIWQAHHTMIAKLQQLFVPKIYVEPEPEDFEEVREYLSDACDIINEWLKAVRAAIAKATGES